MSVFLGATDKPAKTAHTATAKGQPNSLSEASLWRGLKFPARMTSLQQEMHLTWLNCNLGKVKVNLETTLEGQRLNPMQADLCGVDAGLTCDFITKPCPFCFVDLCRSLRIHDLRYLPVSPPTAHTYLI